MQHEFRALQENKTWTLVPRPPGARIITGKWVFKHKFNYDGSLERYKARWVVRGFNQRPSVDFSETLSRRQACDNPHRPHSRRHARMACSPARCLQCVSSWQSP
jgi:hypothetical protein